MHGQFSECRTIYRRPARCEPVVLRPALVTNKLPSIADGRCDPDCPAAAAAASGSAGTAFQTGEGHAGRVWVLPGDGKTCRSARFPPGTGRDLAGAMAARSRVGFTTPAVCHSPRKQPPCCPSSSAHTCPPCCLTDGQCVCGETKRACRAFVRTFSVGAVTLRRTKVVWDAGLGWADGVRRL